MEDTVDKTLAPFNPTHNDAIACAISLFNFAEGGDGEKLIDLGAGDGRVLLATARSFPNITVIGYEYDPKLVSKGRNGISEEPDEIKSRITLVLGDALDADIDDASALFVYLVPQGMQKIGHKLLSWLQCSSAIRRRVVSNIFSIPILEDAGYRRAKVLVGKAQLPVYLYHT